MTERKNSGPGIARLIAAVLLVCGLNVSLASAQGQSAEEFAFEGSFAGTFICASGEMGMTLHLQDAGPASYEEFPDPCRSGSGPCNDGHAEFLASSRLVHGVLNFFPTSGNPDAPAGAFRVQGSADMSISPATRIELEPRDWIVQPTGFGASAMVANLVDDEMVGKPTAPGCHILKLRKLKGV